MLRVAAAAAVALALSGCLASEPAPVHAAPAAPPRDGVVVTATRVEPLTHWVDVVDSVESRPCMGESAPCRMTLTGAGPGLTWQEPAYDFGDPLALFWRVSLVADLEREPLGAVFVGGGMTLEVLATSPCGVACVHERWVASSGGSGGNATRAAAGGSVGWEALDVYLKDGETGVRVRVVPSGSPAAYVGEGRLTYHLHGGVSGYRAVAPPVIVG